MRFDVAIIGGGPAGALCAQRLGAAGARVALIDGSHPREKPCGGGVTGRALALVTNGASLPASAVPVTAATFSFADRTARVPLDQRTQSLPLGVFARREFDAALVDRAAAAGATMIADRVVDVSRNGQGWAVRTRTAAAVQADWLVGADGPNSMVRKRLSRPFDRADLSIACGHFVHGVCSDHIDIVFEDAPAGYLWSFPRVDHLAVGICAQADVASVGTLLPLAERWIAEHVKDARLERYSWPIPSLRVDALERERPAGDRWMLLGDAAGLVDPITREGIYFALDSGDAAASTLLDRGDSERLYVSRLRDTTYRELVLAARLKARFYRAPFMRLLLSALQRSARIRRIMADLVAGDQPYHSLRGRLLRTMEFKLMKELFLR